MNFKESIEAARLRVGTWNRERKERALEREAAKAHDAHAHSRFWLLNVPALATICAAIVEWYWAMLFCIEATGQLGFDWRTSTGSDVAATGAWHFLFDIQNAAVLLGLIAATIPIVMLSMVWLPVQFAMRGAGAWRRGSIIAVGLLANVLVIVSGTVVMNYNRQDQVRETAVVEQTAQQGRLAIDARLAFEQEQLRLALNNSNPYLNQAANVGAAEWERSYVAQARATGDARLPMLERALGAARAADQRRANIEALTVQRAQAAPEAATAANVDDTVGRELNTFAQYVEVWRPPFVAFICTLIGIFGAWWTLAMLERLNPKDVLRSGWAPESLRVEDMRDEPVRAAEPLTPIKRKRKVYNAETGREEVWVEPKGHWRPTGKKQRNADGSEGEEMEHIPEIPPDETGVHDGGNRTASVTIGGIMESAPDQHQEADSEQNERDDVSAAAEQLDASGPEGEAQGNADNTITHPEPPEEEVFDILPDEELELEPTTLDAPVEAPHQDEEHNERDELDQQSEHAEPREEPETDPARMIAAE